MALALTWIILSILVGVYADKKGRSGVGFFFLALVTSPLIGFLIAILSAPKREKAGAKSGMKKCPGCAEYVQGDARICRFCRHQFANDPSYLTESHEHATAAAEADQLAAQTLATGEGATPAKKDFDAWSKEAAASEASSRKAASADTVPVARPSKKRIAVASAVVAALLVGLYFLGRRMVSPEETHGVPASPAQSAAAPPAPSSFARTNSAAQLALLSSRGYQTEGGDYYTVEGEVRNISRERLADVEAVATWYAQNGTFITSDSDLIDYNPIMPGQTSPFKVMSTANPEMDKYSVGFKTVLGLPIATSDERAKEAKAAAARQRAAQEKQRAEEAAETAEEERLNQEQVAAEAALEAAWQKQWASFRYRVVFHPACASYEAIVDGQPGKPLKQSLHGNDLFFGAQRSMEVESHCGEIGLSSAQVNGQPHRLSWKGDPSNGWAAWVVGPQK